MSEEKKSEFEVEYGRIGHLPESEALYKAEDKLMEAFKDAAQELAKLKGWDTRKEFWAKAVPTELYMMLDQFSGGYAAAKKFVEIQTLLGRANKPLLRQRESDYAREHRRKQKSMVFIHYGGNPPKCACCSELIIKTGFPDGYQVLCMNCNWGKRMNKGICPHKVLF
jgi:hypothetical protein